METYQIKKKDELVIILFEVAIPKNKYFEPMKYHCHICGMIGHRMVNCPRFVKMYNTFKDKVTRPLDNQLVVDKTMPTISNNMVAIITHSKNE
jgi:hypothetical protein